MGAWTLFASTPPTPASGTPTWLTVTVLVAAPVLLLLGVLIGHWVTRKGTKELDDRAKREELMRTVRWAAEQIATNDPAAKAMATRVLRALRHSSMYRDEDRDLLRAVLDTPNVRSVTSAYHESQRGEGDDGGS